MYDIPHFIKKAQDIYGYPHFVNDVGGSLCELDETESWTFSSRIPLFFTSR